MAMCLALARVSENLLTRTYVWKNLDDEKRRMRKKKHSINIVNYYTRTPFHERYCDINVYLHAYASHLCKHGPTTAVGEINTIARTGRAEDPQCEL